MNRRWMGALLLIAALTLALVIPMLDGRRSAGRATTIQLPQEPQVGDCVLPSVIDPARTAGDFSASLAPTFTDCEGRSVAGEVVAVAAPAVAVSGRSDDATAGGPDCRQSVLRYSGLELPDGRPLSAELYPTDPIIWDLTLNVRAAWLVPSPLLRSAGQEWGACVATPVGAEPYRGRLAGAFTGGRLPNEFGLCSAESRPSVVLEPVPCGSPHWAELVATASVPGGGRTAVDDIKQSCERIASEVVGLADPTGSGQLSIDTSISPAAGQFLAIPQPLDVTCYLASLTRQLSGTLVGLGDRTIPFAP